jgi:mycofactocin system glycosyltransferase
LIPPALPETFRLAFDADVRRPRPEVLVGGAPLRVLRLTPAGAALVDRWVAGEPVGSGAGAGVLARRLVDAGIADPRPDAGTGPGAGDITVVIPVRDGAAGLAVTLAALARDTSPRQVIIVDDGSQPPVDPAAAHGAEVIRHPDARGPAAARNTGWRAARGGLVAFLDADCAPAPGWLTTLLPHFADPALGAVAPRIASRAPVGGRAAIGAYEAVRSPLDLGPRASPVRPGSRVPYVPTAALVVRRQALEETAGFDEAMHFGEDVDLVWRLDTQGWRVRYQPAASVTHPSRPGLAAWLEQRYHYGRSAAPLAARHRRAVAPLAVSPWSTLAWILVAAGHPWAGAGVTAGTAAALARRAGRDPATGRTLAALAVAGNLRAGPVIAGAVRRAWLPPAIGAAAVAWRLGRRAPALTIGAALALPPLVEWTRHPAPGLGPLRWSALRLADDLAYQAGLWSGVIESRSAAALLPRW